MIGAGTFINPLLKIITTVAILAAVYFFAIRPVLDTTESAFDQFGDPFNALPAQIQDDVDEALDLAGDDAKTGELRRCIENALPDQRRVQRCVDRHTP